jgi:hypothetical protein
LAGSTRVSPQTAEKVRAAARSLGYRTEVHARVLRSGGPDLANIVLDTRLTHTADGDIHPFWARMLTGFLTRMQSHGWLCVVQFHTSEAPVFTVPAPAVALATTDLGNPALFVREAFGQTLLSPVEGDATAGRLALMHNYSEIGSACARYLRDAGCTRVLLVGRTGFTYAEMIVQASADGLREYGITALMAPEDGPVSQRIGEGVTGDVDGILDLSAEPAALAAGLHNRRVVASAPREGEVVVVANADGADPNDQSGWARLSLEGHRSGELAADFLVASTQGREPVPSPELPFAIYPPQPRNI